MKLYIAGPMSGIPSFNLSAFDDMAAWLREQRHEVISPAELDGEETRAVIMASLTGNHKDLPPGETWGFYLARDVKILADDGVEAIVVLPGWTRSPGALLETFTARVLLGMPILRRQPWGELALVSDSTLVNAWMEKMIGSVRPDLFNMKWKTRVRMSRVPRADE